METATQVHMMSVEIRHDGFLQDAHNVYKYIQGTPLSIHAYVFNTLENYYSIVILFRNSCAGSWL